MTGERFSKLYIESLFSTISRLFAFEGAALEVSILATSSANFEIVGYDNWNGGTDYYKLSLSVPVSLYAQIRENRSEIEGRIYDKLDELVSEENSKLQFVQIYPELKKDDKWREKALAWLNGKNVTNQGRVRSDNIASRVHDGLLFRSHPEILLYRALKQLGVSFAPLPVFIKGGRSYQRIEPDFFLIMNGVMMVVEVDGDTVHQETPAEAHARTTMLLHEGVHFERVKASECNDDQKAVQCAKKIVSILGKLKNVR
ncbi:hypothetical protein ACQJ0Y_10300 [Peribacillus simplex]|uniref:hypothetical protein n=1 Tax=Peribacillus simplex TaxID=1478 RepID=UPI003CF7F908